MSKRPSPDSVASVVDLTLDSDDEEESSLAKVCKNLSYIAKKAKKETVEGTSFKIEGNQPAVNYEDVQIVDATAPTLVAAASGNDNDQDIVVVGTVNEVNLPHMRPHCTKFKFQRNPHNKSNLQFNNAKYCDLCYCYVCDCLVKDCKSWALQTGTWSNHCNATDQQSEWVLKRSQNKTRLGDRKPSSNEDEDLLQPQGEDSDGDSFQSPPRVWKLLGVGPWSPDHPRASNYPHLTKCRKCNWYSDLGSDQQWCHKCGRVASMSAFSSKEQSVAYVPKPKDIFLGTKKIPFRLVSRDVRAIEKYRNSWSGADTTTPAWTYDESEMEAELFQNRLGERPTIESIFNLISVYKEDRTRKIAANGGLRKVKISEKNLEAIILDNPNDLTLIRVLHHIVSFGMEPKKNSKGKEIPNKYPNGDITAEWHKEHRKGIITIRVFFPEKCLKFDNQMDSTYSLLLGAWYDCFPFNLVDLTGPLKAEKTKLNGWTNNKFLDAAKKKMNKLVNTHNSRADMFCSQLSLTCSSGNPNTGGITNNNTTLKNMFQRFFSETFKGRLGGYALTGNWKKLMSGRVSNHRKIDHDILHEHFDARDIILSFKDRTFARACLTKEAKKSLPHATAGVMEHLENLGHESEAPFEGLNCEMLPFQKQSLKWALEREQVQGGIQLYFWATVPVQKDGSTTTLYYSPILQYFRNDEPKTVRGGIIAEEMGLGKTIISLALILKNPAPELPISGSPIASLSCASMPASQLVSAWDTNLFERKPADSPKRATILSRGTLVICPVSLVGQWIEEAKSKLKDPGLVYPYHGQNRTRDVYVLAKNAIVVTTYQVLASDDTYHRAKSNDKNYCPPLEQIRWWRIICDEGHTLKEGSTKSNKSIANIVADHKWIVSGTPVNTSITDLKNQLRFLGIEKVEELFRVFCSGNEIISPGKLLFFLRSIMMRHRQNQTYRCTETTLMSLPAKRERSIEVNLTETEKQMYDLLNNNAKTFYVDFKATHGNNLSSHYLKLTQKLTPMRVACSGGFFPLEDEDQDETETENDVDDEEAEGDYQTSSKKTEVKYSNFAFTSKFKVLLSELVRIRDKDPSSKSLIFSQYSSTLNWLKEELPKHGFQFRTLSGNMSMKQRAKALHDFQKDPPTTIFLLSMRAGNCGINLTQANCVFLMEPGFNPALEQQAVGRVHRLGQKREVEVIRLCVKDSVETRICNFLDKKYRSALSNDSGEDEEGNEIANCAVGNIASERPKSKILAEEFDILFGVKEEDSLKPGETAGQEEEDEDMPDAAISSCVI